MTRPLGPGGRSPTGRRQAVTAAAMCGALAMAGALAGCGDNAVPCGDGTHEVDGRCTAPPVITCNDGTQLAFGECVIDPAVCQAGTVLIADRCVDPAHGLAIDLEESAEPNGSAVAPSVEASPAPAGAFMAKPIGETFVIHGHLTPFRDADGDGQLDPDFDTYVITVAAPSLLAISVDGVGGAQGAFYVTAQLAVAGAPAHYERYGLNLTGDTAQRQLFLPAAGDYQLAIADTRSIAIGDHPPPAAGAGGAAGGPTAEYFAAITALAIPAPATIEITGGTGSAMGALAAGASPGAAVTAIDEVRFFTAPLGSQPATIRDTMAGPALASLIVTAPALAGYADEDPGPPSTAAQLALDLHAATAPPLIVADTVYNVGPGPAVFLLAVTVP